MRADLLRHPGARLTSWIDLRAWVGHADPGGPLHRALDSEWWATDEVKLLRNISDSLKWLVWAKTTDGARGVNPPKPTLLTKAEHRSVNPDYGRWTALPIEDIDALLGMKGGDNGG